jgi:hypothetical protein
MPAISSSFIWSLWYYLAMRTIYDAPRYPVFSSLPPLPSHLGPDILFSTLFSNTLNLCSSLSVRDQISPPYQTPGKIMVLYILIFKFLDIILK